MRQKSPARHRTAEVLQLPRGCCMIPVIGAAITMETSCFPMVALLVVTNDALDFILRASITGTR